jgi:hypothetical protein
MISVVAVSLKKKVQQFVRIPGIGTVSLGCGLESAIKGWIGRTLAPSEETGMGREMSDGND